MQVPFLTMPHNAPAQTAPAASSSGFERVLNAASDTDPLPVAQDEKRPDRDGVPDDQKAPPEKLPQPEDLPADNAGSSELPDPEAASAGGIEQALSARNDPLPQGEPIEAVEDAARGEDIPVSVPFSPEAVTGLDAEPAEAVIALGDDRKAAVIPDADAAAPVVARNVQSLDVRPVEPAQDHEAGLAEAAAVQDTGAEEVVPVQAGSVPAAAGASEVHNASQLGQAQPASGPGNAAIEAGLQASAKSPDVVGQRALTAGAAQPSPFDRMVDDAGGKGSAPERDIVEVRTAGAAKPSQSLQAAASGPQLQDATILPQQMRLAAVQPAMSPEAPQPAPQPNSPIVRQVVDQLVQIPTETGTATIRLKPHGMGVIEISVDRAADGRLEVDMRVQNPLVLEAMRNERSAISHLFQPSGGNSGGSLNMDLFQPGTGRGGQGQQQGQTPRTADGSSEGPDRAESLDNSGPDDNAPRSQARSAGGLNILT
ncbi:hypothetical protein AB9K35_04460 [Leisingera sp. XS_AS12]|uniref:hypothetical protein n=1 Tax=Leisingera sp. XS_AS12 TaxID=3241294 RepID=UPI0035153639